MYGCLYISTYTEVTFLSMFLCLTHLKLGPVSLSSAAVSSTGAEAVHDFRSALKYLPWRHVFPRPVSCQPRSADERYMAKRRPERTYEVDTVLQDRQSRAVFVAVWTFRRRVASFLTSARDAKAASIGSQARAQNSSSPVPVRERSRGNTHERLTAKLMHAFGIHQKRLKLQNGLH